MVAEELANERPIMVVAKMSDNPQFVGTHSIVTPPLYRLAEALQALVMLFLFAAGPPALKITCRGSTCKGGKINSACSFGPRRKKTTVDDNPLLLIL